MIKSIKLQNFRQFEKLELDLDSMLTIILAKNTKGKSTILEAIHFVTNQNSPFTSDHNHLFRKEQEKENSYFRIDLGVQQDKETETYGIYQDNRKRSFSRNGSKTTKRKFTENLASNIFSPEQIEILMISPQQRRDFLDHLLSRYDLDFPEDLKRLRRALKQRNSYLKKLSKIFYETSEVRANDQQLLYWTKVFAEGCIKISKTRKDFIQKLTTSEMRIEYEPSMAFNELEEMAVDEDLIKLANEKILSSVKRDIATGYTHIGPHRDDWSIQTDKDIRIQGSRGEKRMAIGRLIFIFQDLLSDKVGFRPTLLLDDISSELDKENTGKILNESVLKGNQVIITTISLEGFPKNFLKDAKIIELE
ncbi:DNA replication/repair protein RecF [Candidatus Nomurabacteria bacterium]|nr:DNA replication/repair protein RecF [Candidatus Nomurabacteria bacterium]